MLRFQIHYLLLISCLLVFIGCAPLYTKMPKAAANVSDLYKFKPHFNVALYNTKVDVVGNHLSGLLLIKKMPDSSTRLVFSNEMGIKFFDFEFDKVGKFKVYSVMKQMNKKAVLTTLRKDFELVLMDQLDSNKVSIREKDDLLYYVFPQSKGSYYYITDKASKTLVRMERVGKKKTVVEVISRNYIQGVPDTIGITHKNLNFTIGLKRIER